MNAFESLIATILEREGFWVQTTFKVELTKEEKKEIGIPTSPRWELDVLGYRPGDNLLWIVECKSYLDSGGVGIKAFKPNTKASRRYKLFNDPKLYEVVTRRLVAQLMESKSIGKSPKVVLCLAAGNIVPGKQQEIEAIFKANGWQLLGPDWIRERLRDVADGGYDNAVAAVTAKLLLRP